MQTVVFPMQIHDVRQPTTRNGVWDVGCGIGSGRIEKNQCEGNRNSVFRDGSKWTGAFATGAREVGSMIDARGYRDVEHGEGSIMSVDGQRTATIMQYR